MRKLLFAVLKFFHGIYFRFLEFGKLLANKKYYISSSYFPECKKRKCVFRVFMEQCWNIIYRGDINEFYFLYGFDVKGFRKPKNYIDNREFIRQRNKLNKENLIRPICVLRNKFLFGVVAESLGISTPHNVGIINGKEIFLLDEKKRVNLKSFLSSKQEMDVFVKTVNGECADGVFTLRKVEGDLYFNKKKIGIDELYKYLEPNMSYIVQERITEHVVLNKLYGDSINTVRLETVVNPRTKQIEILPPLLRVGTSGRNVDNWAMGGLAIGINEDGSLKKYGFYKPAFGTKAERHPNSDIIFEGYHLPFFKEAIESALLFHHYLQDIHSIGWDIALTESGPCFIEGNDNWEISLVQITSMGLEKRFKELFFN